MKTIFLKREREASRLCTSHSRILGRTGARDPIAFAAVLEVLG